MTLFVAAELTNCAADNGQLKGVIEEVEKNAGSRPEVALADAGYRSEATLAQLSDSGIEVIGWATPMASPSRSCSADSASVDR